MAATPFRAISWEPTELVTEAKMDQLASNQRWLYENSPRALYSLPSGAKRAEGVKIMAGKAYIAPNTKGDTRTVNVGFANFFSSGCQPIVTTGIISGAQDRIFCVTNGLGSALHPDHRGFQITVNIAAELKKNDKIKSAFYVAWQAMGY